MYFKLNLAATAVLTVCLAASFGQAIQAQSPLKKHAETNKVKIPPSPSIEAQVQALREELEGENNSLKTDLAVKDAQLQKAQQVAADAQAAAARAEAAAARAEAAVNAQQQAATENTTAVTTLQAAVTDLKGTQAFLATAVSDETAKLKKEIANPTILRYKGISIAPYGFIAGESAYRAKATGGEMATPFSALPYEGADAYSMSEMYISGRQTRPGVIFEGKTNWGTMRAIVEGDFLGAGTTSNDNQSESYLFRQRIALGEVETNSGWTVSGGQGWSLVTENRKGISTAAANIALPNQIDPNYVTGLIWARSGSFRLTKSFKNASFAVSAENPQLLYTASLAGNTPYAVVGSAGVNGGLLNNAISACSPSTSIVNYTNQALITSGGQTVNAAVPVYKTVSSCANLANISFNEAPDMVVKGAIDTKLGHYELFGVGRFFHETVYTGETTNSNLYGGLKDVLTGVAVAPALSTSSSVADSVIFGGMGASARVPMYANKFVLGAKGLFGPGVGHFGDSTLSDATSNSSGGLAPIHNLSGLLTLEANPSPRLLLYAYYGGDYAGREDYSNASTTTLGAPNPCYGSTGGTCLNEVAGTPATYPLTLPATLTGAQITGNKWGGTWAAPSQAAVGYGSRYLSNSSCTSTTAPGYNGSSTGYYTGGSCGAQTRDTQEITGGYWYDIYKGDRGRLRQGVQYGYAVREGWSGVGGIGAKGVDNMFFTSFRYYLP
ncbi:MAG: hypothetical protein ABSE55_14090 [Terracidiphilus sp.]|jgi:hypothetical protein